jgi:hypothetical protein
MKYTKGYDLISTKSITKKGFIELCILLSNEFNNYYNTNEYVLTPEAISEGGILFKNFNDGEKYKSMRLRKIVNNDDYYRNACYGTDSFYKVWINRNELEEWENNEEILCDKDTIITTFLKSSDGTQPYTIEELKIFEKCFNQIGINVISKYPTKKSLKKLC